MQVIAIALYFFIIFCIEKAEALLKAAWNLIQAAFLVDRAGIEPAMFRPRQGKFAKRVPVKQIRPQPGVAAESNSR